MANPEITVILPCFNAEKYIGLTIDSVLAQSYDNVRVIAVDDGCTDDTAAILETYSDRITVVAHEDLGNHGQAGAFNLGLSYAGSEYIAFMDNDDIWHPDKLKKQVEILNQHNDVGLVYTNGLVIDAAGNKIHDLFPKDHHESNVIGNVLLDCYIRTPSMVMVRSSIFQTVGQFTVGLISSDHDMWIRLQECTKFYYLNEMLTFYRQHPGQMSIIGAKKLWENGFWILNEAMKRHPYPEIVRRKRRAVIHYRLGEYSVRSTTYFAAAYHFFMAFINDPSRALKSVKSGRL